MASSNEAIAALARVAGVTAEKMHARAAAIGMTHTSFTEPTGLDPANVASAHDAALLVRDALDHPGLKDVLALRAYSFTAATGRTHSVRSTDQLFDTFLDKPPYRFLGGKTGTLDEAGYCFGAAAENADGDRIVAVVLGAATRESRFQETKSLLYWTFDAFTWPPR